MTKRKSRKEKATAGRDRHGLPQLTGADDLLALFGAAPEAPATAAEEPGPTFSELFSKEEMTAGPPEKKEEAEQSAALAAASRDKTSRPPLETIDLHGLGARQAEIRTESFIKTAWAGGLTTLRIITGKGLHSQGEAVLQEVVAAKLAHLQESGLVAESRWEKGARQRSGAVIVRLAKRSRGRGGEGAKRRKGRS